MCIYMQINFKIISDDGCSTSIIVAKIVASYWSFNFYNKNVLHI